MVNQTLKDIEIILVNNGSTDNSLKIAEGFAKQDSRIKIIHQANQNQGAARNIGIKIAQSEYIGFVDSDDRVDLDYFEKLYNSAEQYNSDIAIASSIRIDTILASCASKNRLIFRRVKHVKSLQDKFNLCKQANNPCPTNKIYRASLLRDNNILFQENVFCEDKLFPVQAIYYANGVVRRYFS